MSENQTTSPSIKVEIDNHAMGDNSFNIINNYFASSPQNTTNDKTLPNLPNQVLEAITTIKKFLSRQSDSHKITITKENVTVNKKTIFVNYEACKICKNQHGNLNCLTCQRKVCPSCVVKSAKIQQCLRCKGSEKTKSKIASEFEDKIEKLLRLESNDKIEEVILAEAENLGNKNLEELIEIVKILKKKGDKLDREISLAYFYVGKIFYERMEEFFGEGNLAGEQKNRKFLSSFRYAKDLDFGEEKMSIIEIKEKLGVDDNKVSRFFGLTLKIFLTYKDFSSAEEQIRKAKHIPSAIWLRDLSQEMFLDFLGKLEQAKKEEENI